jgi:hypothetical protein
MVAAKGILILKKHPPLRWIAITSGCFLGGFIAGPFGMLGSVFGAPIAAAILVKARSSKLGTIAIQSSHAVLAFYIAAFISTLGMIGNPLWYQGVERSQRPQLLSSAALNVRSLPSCD